MLAEINVCQYFQMVNEYYNFNDYYYYYKQMYSRFYQDLLQELDFKLRTKRLIDDNDIDFSISYHLKKV